ncbi:MAG: cellulose biosynthesis protein BcsS [Nitrospira sp.]|nr:cellulose biosynthesis protein BcsS [Nitrospira sp.]
MTRAALLLSAVLILIAGPATSQAGDVFTGFQIDNKNQYMGYLGVRTPLLQMSGETTLFVQIMTAGLGYSSKVNGQVLDSNVQFVVPSLGISQTIGGWTLSALAGPQLRRIEEQRFNASASIDHQAGAYGQLEALYWHEKGSLHAIASYADLDNFFWSRLRGKLLAYQTDKGCCKTYVGWDVAAMGNADFKAVQTGPLVEVPIGKVFLLAKGGYQNSSSFHSGAYGGFEIYFPF